MPNVVMLGRLSSDSFHVGTAISSPDHTYSQHLHCCDGSLRQCQVKPNAAIP